MVSTVAVSGIRVLIVDDDRSILRIIAKILERKGFIVDTTESGQEAIDKLTAETYAVAIIDVRLQDTNGIDLLERIQEIAPDMRKIVLTGYPSDEDRIKALKRGVEYYLAKPVDSEKLIEIISGRTKKYQSNNF